MTNEELKTDLFNLLKAKRLEYTVFKDLGSIHLTATMVAGLSCTKVMSTSNHSNTWNYHYVAAKWLTHFDTRPGIICSAMALSVIDIQSTESQRYKDMVSALSMIPNVSITRLINENNKVKSNPDLIPSVDFQEIKLALDCTVLANEIAAAVDTHIERPPVGTDDCLDYTERQKMYTAANPVLRDIHADLMEAYIRLYR